MKKHIYTTVEKTIGVASDTLGQLESEFEQTAKPIRQTVFSRFPMLFILLTTFGVTAVIHSLDSLIGNFEYLHERPLLLLAIGVTVLSLTGTLYAKLGMINK